MYNGRRLNDLNQDKYLLLDNDECEIVQIHITDKSLFGNYPPLIKIRKF